MKKVLLAAVFALAGVSFFSCSSSSSDDELFSMNERAITLQKGDNYTITHTGKASWSSEDTFVASVNDGDVTANHVGETAIYAMSGGSKSQIRIIIFLCICITINKYISIKCKNGIITIA